MLLGMMECVKVVCDWKGNKIGDLWVEIFLDVLVNGFIWVGLGVKWWCLFGIEVFCLVRNDLCLIYV